MTTIMLPRALIAGDGEALEAIRDPDISIAIWERPAPAAVADLLGYPFSDLRLASPLGLLPDALQRAIDAAGYPQHGARLLLEADIVALARRFACIMQVDAIDIRLDRITGNACRKFHADYVTARLITTYVGRGTQWLDGDASEPCDCGNPHDVRELRAGDVAILKGRSWDEARAAIHRSPPIAGSGEQRLLLAINPAKAAD